MKKDQGSYTFSCHNLLNPIAEGDKKFRMEWIRYWDVIPDDLVIIIPVDPANTIKKRSDYTAMTVHGFDSKQNWYILDLYRDKLESEDDRALKLFELHKKWKRRSQINPIALYEAVGFQISDKSNIERKQQEQDYYFEVFPMKGGALHKNSKVERIKSLQPYFERNQVGDKSIFIPRTCKHYSKYHKREIDMTREFLYEYEFFTPNNTHLHDDLIDTLTFPLYWERFKHIRANKKVVEVKDNLEWDIEESFLRLTDNSYGKTKIGYF